MLKRKSSRQLTGEEIAARLSLDSWLNCERCALHTTRRRVVIGRGHLPCRLMLVGIAPGASENLVGFPFVGTSGKLQRSAKREAREKLGIKKSPRELLTNIIACRATDEEGRNRDPTPKEALACWPRLEALLDASQAELVVAVGQYAFRELKDAVQPSRLRTITHPAAVVRIGGRSSRYWRRYVRDWMEIYKELNKGAML